MLLFDDERFDLHDPGPGHVDRPERLAAARRSLVGLLYEPRAGRLAEPHELRTVHTAGHSARVLALDGRTVALDPDTQMAEGSVEAARCAAGASLDAADALLAGNSSFVLCRPPGHHAESGRAMGFCIFNNGALAAERLRARPEGRGPRHRVAIFDHDVHHGNGTQEVFYERGDVLYISMHRFPFYPHSGAPHEQGRELGRGTTMNVPMPSGAGDAEYVAAFGRLVLPALERFGPEYVLISAGFDALAGDPLGGMNLSCATLAAMWGALVDRWPCMSVLEGGYSPARLGEGVRATAGVLAGEPAPALEAGPPSARFEALLDRYQHPLLTPGRTGWSGSPVR